MDSDDDQPTPVAKDSDLSGKIMMSAIIVLLAVVVVMVFLHIYSRWYILRGRRRSHPHRRRGRRRTHLVFYVEPTNPASSLPSRGLDAAVLKSLPTFVFSAAGAANATEEESVLECAVCLSEFEDGEKGRLLPNCGHSFHVDCIDMWFHSHSTCPLCRAPVDGEIPTPADVNPPVDLVDKLSESTRNEPPYSDPPTSSGLCADCRLGSSSSFGGRRKGLDLVGVTVEVPARTASLSFHNSDELGLGSPADQGFKSPTSRLLALKRILSGENKPVPSPSSYSSGNGTSCAELADIEEGRVETRTSLSRVTTPR